VARGGFTDRSRKYNPWIYSLESDDEKKGQSLRYKPAFSKKISIVLLVHISALEVCKGCLYLLKNVPCFTNRTQSNK